MLTIRNEQMDAITARSREQYSAIVVERLLRDYPEECRTMDREQLQRLVFVSVAKAGTFGLKTDEHVQQFVESTLLLGDDFTDSEEFPWAADLLKDEHRSAAIKALKLREHTERAIAAYMSAVDAELLAEPEDA